MVACDCMKKGGQVIFIGLGGLLYFYMFIVWCIGCYALFTPDFADFIYIQRYHGSEGHAKFLFAMTTILMLPIIAPLFILAGAAEP